MAGIRKKKTEDQQAHRKVHQMDRDMEYTCRRLKIPLPRTWDEEEELEYERKLAELNKEYGKTDEE